MFNFNIVEMILWVPAVLIALTLHEYAHGKVADYLGDPTPRAQGRLTLNPLAHLDPIGTLLLLVAHFGWAKPVQVNPLNFRGDRQKGMMLVGIAGPAMNLLVAFTGLLVMNLALPQNADANSLMVQMLNGLVLINIYLAVFNLLPIPPLDGSQVLAGFLRSDEFTYQLGRYGTVILMVLVFSGLVGSILTPIAYFIYKQFGMIAHLLAAPFLGL